MRNSRQRRHLLQFGKVESLLQVRFWPAANAYLYYSSLQGYMALSYVSGLAFHRIPLMFHFRPAGARGEAKSWWEGAVRPRREGGRVLGAFPA